MDPMTLGAIAGLGALGTAGNVYSNERNLSHQREALAYNKWAQEQTWLREDNAVRRRAADLEAAGLSKTLAAGSAAQAGPATKIEPLAETDPLGTSGMLAGIAQATNTARSLADVARTSSEIDLNFAKKLKTMNESGIAGKELALYGSTMADARKHPKFLDPNARLIAIAEDMLKALAGKMKMPKLPKGITPEGAGKKLDHPAGWMLRGAGIIE